MMNLILRKGSRVRNEKGKGYLNRMDRSIGCLGLIGMMILILHLLDEVHILGILLLLELMMILHCSFIGRFVVGVDVWIIWSERF
jgi:hypothetical protein